MWRSYILSVGGATRSNFETRQNRGHFEILKACSHVKDRFSVAAFNRSVYIAMHRMILFLEGLIFYCPCCPLKARHAFTLFGCTRKWYRWKSIVHQERLSHCHLVSYVYNRAPVIVTLVYFQSEADLSGSRKKGRRKRLGLVLFTYHHHICVSGVFFFGFLLFSFTSSKHTFFLEAADRNRAVRLHDCLPSTAFHTGMFCSPVMHCTLSS